MLIQESCTSDKGVGESNEDLAGVGDRWAWVLDGATGVNSYEYLQDHTGVTDAAWLVSYPDQVLRQLEVIASDWSIREVFAELAERVAAALAASEYPTELVPPACSAAIMCQKVPDRIEIGIVGDITVYSAESRILIDNQYFSKREASAVINRSASPRGLTPSDQASIGARRRHYIAGTGGHFILSGNVHVGHGVQHSSIPVGIGSRLLCCTDVFARLVDSYRIYPGWSELSDAGDQIGLGELISQLRGHEISAETESRHYKTRDDATALIIRVGRDNKS